MFCYESSTKLGIFVQGIRHGRQAANDNDDEEAL